MPGQDQNATAWQSISTRSAAFGRGQQCGLASSAHHQHAATAPARHTRTSKQAKAARHGHMVTTVLPSAGHVTAAAMTARGQDFQPARWAQQALAAPYPALPSMQPSVMWWWTDCSFTQRYVTPAQDFWPARCVQQALPSPRPALPWASQPHLHPDSSHMSIRSGLTILGMQCVGPKQAQPS